MEMAPVLRRLEKTVDRQINPTIFTHDDFVKKSCPEESLSADGYAGKKIMVIHHRIRLPEADKFL